MIGRTVSIRNKRDPVEAALEVLEGYWADADGVVSFPVDPVKIAEQMGAKVLVANLANDVAGLLVREKQDDDLKILLNRGDSLSRQRMTCAHEVGHVVKLIDSKAPIGFVEYRTELTGRAKDPDEIFANSFAAELLMPGSAVRKWWSSGLNTGRMAKIFNVSDDALENRLSSLGLSVA